MGAEEQIPIEQENKAEEIKSEKVLDFENLDENQIQALKNEIEKHEGLIRVFIHTDWFTDVYEERIKKPMIRTLRSENSPPIFFLEDTHDLDDIKKVFGILNSDGKLLAKPVYLVETMRHLPYPIMQDAPPPEVSDDDGSKIVSDENLKYGHKSTGRFLFMLHVLGVKKILVGGNELIIDNSKNINKCVGNFVKILDDLRDIRKKYPDMPEIDYKVSEFTGPKNRGDLRGIRDDLV